MSADYRGPGDLREGLDVTTAGPPVADVLEPRLIARGPADAASQSTASPSPLTRVSRFLPSVLLILFVLHSVGPIRDPDTFWHIRAGELILRDWHFVRSPAEFSAAAERPWIFNQWLPQVAMRAADVAAGLPGVAWLFTAAVAALVAACWAICRQWSDPLVASVVMALTYLAMSGSLAPRPQLVTFGLVLITSNAWLKTVRDGRTRWWLVPVAWIWAMSHGLWLMGPIIGFSVTAGMALARTHPPRRLLHLTAIPLLSFVTAAVTPVGPTLLLSPLQVGDVTRFISEWQPVRTTEPVLLSFLVLSLPVIFDIARRPVRAKAPEGLVLLMAYVLAFTYARTIAVAAALLVPLAAATLQQMVRRPLVTISRMEHVTVTAATVFVLAASALLTPRVAATEDYGARDVSAALAAIPAGAVICNEWDWGGWMTYRHPGLLVTMDPRVEIYTPSHIEQYLGFVGGQPGWGRYVDTNGCSYALLRRDRPTVELLRTHGWSVLSQGATSVLLKR